jgi:exosortase/archaeosortase family protein
MISLVPIAVLKNGARIATLSWLSVYWDKKILASDLHTRGGFVFFIIALVLAGAVTVLLRKAEGRLFSEKDKDHES